MSYKMEFLSVLKEVVSTELRKYADKAALDRITELETELAAARESASAATKSNEGTIARYAELEKEVLRLRTKLASQPD